MDQDNARPQPRKCPSKKKCFVSEAEAEPYVISLKASDHPARARLIHTYRCGRCGWIHVGHDRGPVHARTTRRGKHAPRYI